MGVPATIEQETNGAVALPTQDQAALDVFGLERDFVFAQRKAKLLAASTRVPKEYQNNIPNILVAMELATRIGVSVLATMQNLFIINGRPSWSATFLISTVNSCGRFTPIRYRFQSEEGKDDWGCRAVATDIQPDEECVGTLITIAMAKKEGWHGKSGSKWQTMPEQMLMYRAAAFWTRIYAPELSLGMHTSDEMTDIYVRPATSKTTTLSELTAEPTQEAPKIGEQIIEGLTEFRDDLRSSHQATAMGGQSHANGGTDATAPVSETLFKDENTAKDGGVSEIHRELVVEFESKAMGNASIVSLLKATAKVSRIEDLDEEMAGRVLGILRERKD